MQPSKTGQRKLAFERSQAETLQDSYSSTKNLVQNCNISESLSGKLAHANQRNLANQQTQIVMGIDTVIINAQPAVVVQTNEFNLSSWKLNKQRITQEEFESLDSKTFIQHHTDAVQVSYFGNKRLKAQFNARKVLGYDLKRPVTLKDFDDALTYVIDKHLRKVGFYVDDFKHVHFARVDVCFDIYSNIPSRPIREVMKDASAFNGSQKNEPRTFLNSMYSGIKSVGWKVYDKQIESNLADPCTRIEASIKGKYNQRIFACHKLKDWHQFNVAGVFDRFQKDFPGLSRPMDFSLPAYSDMTANEHKLNAELQSVKRMGGQLWSDKVENYLSGLKNVSRSTKSRKRKRLMQFANLSELQTEIPAEAIRTQLDLANLKEPLIDAFNGVNG